MKNELIILGENTPNNINWIKRMNDIYKSDYNVSTLFFENWKDNTMIDFDKEIKKLVSLCKNTDNYIIIAKSAGAILSVLEIEKNTIKPKVLIVMGFPLLFTLNNNINIIKMFNDISVKCKVLVIQQKFDPQGKAKDIEKMLNKNITVETIQGNNHVYANFSLIKNEVYSFINSNCF